jgi:hypothetical protein
MAAGERRMKWAAGAIVFLFAWSLTTHGKYSATGDEPHFLMIAQSLLADHDLDVANNYANDDGRLFGHDNLEMGLHAVPGRNGQLRPAHDIGLPVLLLPIYAGAQLASNVPSESLLARFRMDRGLFAYSIIGLFLIALTAAGLMLLGEGLVALTSPQTAVLLIVAAGISPPIVSHSFLVFPEVLALFVTSLILWFSLSPSAAFSRANLITLAFVLGALPWAHHKYLPYVFGLALLVVWKRWADFGRLSRRDWAIAIALFTIPQLGLQLWTWREWGTLTGTLTTNDVPFSFGVLRTGFVGLLEDRQSGLLAYAPLYWVVPACWYLTRKTTWPLLIPAALLYLPAAAFTHGWWAGFSPAARYIVPLMPIFIVVIADAWRYRAVQIAFIALLVPQLMIDTVIWQHPRTLWPAVDATSANAGNLALEALGGLGRAYEHLLPAAQLGAPVGAAFLGLVIVSAGLAGLAYLRPAATAASISSGE